MFPLAKAYLEEIIICLEEIHRRQTLLKKEKAQKLKAKADHIPPLQSKHDLELELSQSDHV